MVNPTWVLTEALVRALVVKSTLIESNRDNLSWVTVDKVYGSQLSRFQVRKRIEVRRDKQSHMRGNYE